MSVGKNNRGTNNFKCKLVEDDVKEIYLSDERQIQLADRYQVSQSTINHIKKKRTWAWLTDKIDRE